MKLASTQIKPPQTLTLNSGKTSSNTFTVGQQVSATVLKVNSSTREVTLNIQNTSINAKSNLPLIPGQSLKLAVVQSGKETVLQVQQDVAEKTITKQTLRESLPKQQALNETLKNLEQVAKEGKNLGVSEKIIQLTQRFIQQIPNTRQLSQALGLKDAILRSGVFFENTLANTLSKNGKEKINVDFKSFLLQLKSLLLNEKNNALKQNPETRTDKQQFTTDAKILDIAKQMKNAEEGKQLSAKEQIQTTNQQVKNALQQALLTINQQQKAINYNLSRLLNNATTNMANPNQKMNQPAPPPIKENPSQPLLKDALAFTVNTQKSQQANISFSRFGNLTDLLDTLLKQVDAAISRTQLHQLNSLLEPENGKLNWSMEIPVKVNENLHSIHLHLEKEPGADEDADPVLTVSIALDLENLGPVYARITLITENVGVVIWAEREKTYQLTQDHVEDLQANLSKSGLKPENISFHRGQPPHNPVLQKTQKSALLDIKV